MRPILWIFCGVAFALSCNADKKLVQEEKTARKQLPTLSCPCLYAQIFPYQEITGERRIAVHVFNLAETALQANLSMTTGGETVKSVRDVPASDRVLVTFSASDMIPLEKYEVRVQAMYKSAPVDSLVDVVRLSQFEMDHLVRLHLNP